MADSQSDISLLIISVYNLIALAVVLKWYVPELRKIAEATT